MISFADQVLQINFIFYKFMRIVNTGPGESGTETETTKKYASWELHGLSLRLCFLKGLGDRQKHLIHVLGVANNYYRT